MSLIVGKAMNQTNESASSALRMAFRPPVLAIAAVVGVVMAATLALWAHYGTAVFYETIAAALAACL